MATAVLIIGKSGSGKSASLRNCINNPDWNLVKVIDKPLPFRGKIPAAVTDDYRTLAQTLLKSEAKSIVIDDAGYLLTNMFMRGHSVSGAGKQIFDFYNKIADQFWQLITFIQQLPADKIVYMIMHEDKNEFGDVKAKTIGNLLDEKVTIEGMFTIVFRCVEENGKHLFITQSADGAISKSPIGMFEELKIDNDLAFVDAKIREYYADEKEENNEDPLRD